MKEHAAVGGDRGQRQALHAGGAERLLDRKRPVGEMALRAQQLDLDAIAGQRLQSKHRLESGHTPAGDEHTGER